MSRIEQFPNLAKLLRDSVAQAERRRVSGEKTKTLLGEVVIEFNNLDILVTGMIGAVLGTNTSQQKDTFDYVASFLSFINKIQILQSLIAAMVKPTLHPDFKKVIASLRRCNSDRNKYIHAFWAVGVEEEAYAYVRGRRHEVTHDELIRVKNSCTNAYTALAKFVQTNMNAPR